MSPPSDRPLVSDHDDIREINGPVGRLEALQDEAEPGRLRAAVVVAHPHPKHGGMMHTKVVCRVAKAFRKIGCVTLRFNFRGVGTSAGYYDEGRGEKDDYSAAIDFMAGRYPGVELWAVGFSFGAWIAWTVGAEDPRVTTLVGIALPTGYDLSAVTVSAKPKFLIHGERDELIPLQKMWRFYGRLEEPKELVVIDAANHLFNGHVGEVGDAIEDLLVDHRSLLPSC